MNDKGKTRTKKQQRAIAKLEYMERNGITERYRLGEDGARYQLQCKRSSDGITVESHKWEREEPVFPLSGDKPINSPEKIDGYLVKCNREIVDCVSLKEAIGLFNRLAKECRGHRREISILYKNTDGHVVTMPANNKWGQIAMQIQTEVF